MIKQLWVTADHKPTIPESMLLSKVMKDVFSLVPEDGVADSMPGAWIESYATWQRSFIL